MIDSPRAADAPLPHPIFCRGVLPSGKRCRTMVARVENGIVVFRHAGWEIPDPPSVKCGRCKSVRHFRGGVPEELGGSTGVYVGGELRGTRLAATA